MSKFDDRFDRLEGKLDTIDNKLDDHLARLSVAETSIEFIKGHLKITLTFALAVITALLGAIVQGYIQ